jgi:hypothetical protein
MVRSHLGSPAKSITYRFPSRQILRSGYAWGYKGPKWKKLISRVNKTEGFDMSDASDKRPRVDPSTVHRDDALNLAIGEYVIQFAT